MKRVFELSWADEHGEMWMNKDNLETLLRTEGFVDSRIQFEVEDVTDAVAEAAGEQPPKPKETKPKVAKPAEPQPTDEAKTEKRGPCRFKVSSKCHRFPPKIVVEGSAKQYLNPGTQDGCWCGEYQLVANDASASE